MPDLAHSLRNYDLERLNNIAEVWGIELFAADSKQAATQLAEAVLNPNTIKEFINSLPGDANAALAVISPGKGRIPWSRFTRQFGEVREMGPGKRSRQQPHRNTDSIAETLWYRGLVARAFFDTPAGPQEFAYIPIDILSWLSLSPPRHLNVYGRPASKGERVNNIPAGDRILDHACTLLAAKRVEATAIAIGEISADWSVALDFVTQILFAAGLLGKDGKPKSENMRAFLEADRAAALSQLFQAWLGSNQINDLLMLPHLAAQGQWDNHPIRSRKIFVDFLEKVPDTKWWSLTAFIKDIHQHQPDFQRPAGDYDSWYLKDARTGEYLRGFEDWHSVDGEFIRYLISGPLHWLGILDLAVSKDARQPSAFRFSAWGRDLLAGGQPKKLASETAKLSIDSKGTLTIPHMFPRAARYQVSRFCDYISESIDAYILRITSTSLAKAHSQGLTVNQFLALLRKHAADPASPNFLKALERWEQHGTQVRIENVLVLRVNSPDILKELQDSRAARFLGDPIGPTNVQVKPGARQQILDALAGLGYIGDSKIEESD